MSRLKYYFMPSRWRSFGIYLLRELLKRVDDREYTPEVHEVEQFMFRYLTCHECMEEGECQYSDCRCKMPERAHVRTDFCPMMKWGPFKTAQAWKDFKDREQIRFHVKHRSL